MTTIIKNYKLSACTAPFNSLLTLYSQRHVHSIYDCFVVHVVVRTSHPQHILIPKNRYSAHDFATHFFQSKAFWFESLLLKSIRWCINVTSSMSTTTTTTTTTSSTHLQSSNHHPENKSFASGFFNMIDEKHDNQSISRQEILLDSGPFLTWLAITPPNNISDSNQRVLQEEEIVYHFGTLTKEPNIFIRWIYPIHIWYTKILLLSGIRQHLLFGIESQQQEQEEVQKQ